MFSPMGSTIVERYRAARRDSRRTVLEGFHVLKHALRFGAEIEEVAALDPDDVERLAAELAPDLAADLRNLVRRVEGTQFAVLSPARVHTGVIAIARRPDIDVDAALAAPESAPVVVLENPRSPYNVGAAIRVAAAAGAAGLFVTGLVDPWGPTALRAAAGLNWALPVAQLFDLPSTDRPLVALDPEGEDMNCLPPRAMLVFGTERDGLSRATIEAADVRIRIPMRPGVSSLNLATAVAATLYGAWR